MINEILKLIDEYAKVHSSAKSCGREYISQDDSAQIDALDLVCDIFELYKKQDKSVIKKKLRGTPRQILFRAKRVDDGEWVEGYYYKRLQDGRVVDAIEVCNGYASSIEYYEINPQTLSQFTGKTDRNGVKIWENSIVKQESTSPLGWHRERHSKVSFDKEGYWMLTTQYGDGYWIGDFEDEQLEVIGNIFDNPELMEIQ